MGAAREGFNLFRSAGRYHFSHRRWGDVPWRYVWLDTVMPLVCSVIGHVEYDCSDPGEVGTEFACRRCHQFTRHVPRPQPSPDAQARYPNQPASVK
jgi:hypothetical protein